MDAPCVLPRERAPHAGDERHSAKPSPSRDVADAGAVRLAGRSQRAGQLVVALGLGLAALLLEATAERVVAVVVDGGELEELAELGLGFLVSGDPEVGDSEGPPGRGLLRLPPLRLLERDRGLSGHALTKVGPALLEQVVRLAHPAPVSKVRLFLVKRIRQTSRRPEASLATPYERSRDSLARPLIPGPKSARSETRPMVRSVRVSAARSSRRSDRSSRRAERAA